LFENLVLALPFLEAHQRDVLTLQEIPDASDETVRHDAGLFGGSKPVAQVSAKEPGHSGGTGQLGT